MIMHAAIARRLTSRAHNIISSGREHMYSSIVSDPKLFRVLGTCKKSSNAMAEEKEKIGGTKSQP